MNTAEITVFICYLIFMLAVGIYFFCKDKDGGEKSYFLGNRNLGAWVSALSTGASDMSAWVLMGLPTAIYAYGLGEVWISFGLALGYACCWIIEAPRLRRFSIVSGDAITVPQYLSNRFLSKSKVLQIVCALVFLVAYTVYMASSVKACGILFHKVIGIAPDTAMLVAVFIIVGYTFLGGFAAVCWTDFFQGLLILGAMLIAPICAAFVLEVSPEKIADPDYWDLFGDWKKILSGLAWGLGYFGMPHIIIRFLGIRSDAELKKSRIIGISWTVLIVIFAALIGIVGRRTLGMNEDICKNELVFVQMVRLIFPGVISGILLSAVLAASMSTADSQLLSASSALASDICKPLFGTKRMTDKRIMWIGRIVVLLVAFAALALACMPGAGSIMSLVGNAWGVFGAAFGPAILLSLFWKRFNFAGAAAGIIVGALADIAFLFAASATGIYELFPGFFTGAAAAVIATICTAPPSKGETALFERAVAYRD
ncbi:MAG: sodium/proline symporter [Victivallaceae bacterium]|nr:sodium/proline symporter [Victivallaceae bacterium]